MDEFKEFVAERLGYFDQIRSSIDEVRALIGGDTDLLSHLNSVERGIGFRVGQEIKTKLNEMKMKENN